MTGRGKTKDESFLIRLYEEASKQTDPEEPIDRYIIGNLVGLQKTAVDTICILLIRANFVKKDGEVNIFITPHGMKLAKNLKES